VETLLDLEFIWTIVDIFWESVIGSVGFVGHLESMLLCHWVVLMSLEADKAE